MNATTKEDVLDYTIEQFIDLARERGEFKSDNLLSQSMGFSGSPLSLWRHRKAFPSDENMYELARRAGVDENIGLMLLNAWRTKGAVSQCYRRIAKILIKMAIICMICINFSENAQSRTNIDQSNIGMNNSVYYVLFRSQKIICFGLNAYDPFLT